jgi:uncharacterized protein (TIGR04255 family)
MFQEVAQEFPKKRHVPVSLQFGHPGGPRLETGLEKIQFLRDDESALIQLSPNTLGINHLKPYPGWETVKSTLIRQFKIYRKIAKPQALKRVGLRYINEIIVDSNEFDISSHFFTFPRYPTVSEATKLATMNVQASRKFADPAIQLNITLTDRSQPQTDGSSSVKRYIFDLDAFAIDNEAPAMDGIEICLDLAHQRLEDFFDASFSEDIHEHLFGEVKP